MSSILSYLWGESPPLEQEVDTDRVIPIPTEEEIPDISYYKDRSPMLDHMLQSQVECNNKLKKALVSSFCKISRFYDSYTTYQRVTWGIILFVPLVNCLVRPEFGIVFSFLSFATLLSISEFDIMSDGYQMARLYRSRALETDGHQDIIYDVADELD